MQDARVRRIDQGVIVKLQRLLVIPILELAVAFLELGRGCEYGDSSAFPTAVTVASGKQLAQTDTLPLLRLPVRRQTMHMQSKETERFLNFKCKTCNGEFASSRSYDSHCRRQNARETLCSDESSRLEITVTGHLFSARYIETVLRSPRVTPPKKNSHFIYFQIKIFYIIPIYNRTK